jgi:DNA-binding response OmpR family regulator
MTTTLETAPVAAHASQQGVEYAPRPLKPSANILIIEDDGYLVAALARRLRRAGFGVDAAADGTAGLQQALLDEPDLVLLDLGLPGMRGLKVLHEIRKSKPLLPIVIITGDLCPDLDRRVAGFGVMAVFRKPFSSCGLIRLIDRLL